MHKANSQTGTHAVENLWDAKFASDTFMEAALLRACRHADAIEGKSFFLSVCRPTRKHIRMSRVRSPEDFHRTMLNFLNCATASYRVAKTKFSSSGLN